MAVLALVLALLAVLPAGAHAAGDLEIGIADDAALLKEGDPERGARLVADWRATGIDAVRVFAEWRAVSPGEAGPYRPEGFNPADPDDPAYRWQDLDRAIRLVGEAGLRVILSVSGPGPLWATADPGTGDQRRRPRPDAFGVFAGAVARRYGAAVDRYIIWNEPNLPLWLKPQFSCRAPGRCVPYAPHLYRRLVRAAYEAIHANDARAEVLFGALAPRGHDPRRANATMRPLTFLRALGCVDQRLRRTRRGPCGGFRPLTADAFAYHPHGVRRAPDVPSPHPDEAALADLPRLIRVLDGAHRAGGFGNARGGRFDLYFTEYGYQTRPPDRGPDGVALTLQSRWLQQAAYVAWRAPRVRNLTQYAWRDEPLRYSAIARTRYAGWQSGLHFRDGRPKPALRSFRQPFWVQRRRGGRLALLWGQVRPGGAHTVAVQRRAPGAAAWTTVARLRTDARGVFTLRRALRRPLLYRFTWQPAPEVTSASDAVAVAPGQPRRGRARRG